MIRFADAGHSQRNVPRNDIGMHTQDSLGLREAIMVFGVKVPCNISGEFQVLCLVVANRNMSSASVNQ